MSHALLCVQFRNLLPSEDILLFARTLWGAAQRDGPSAFQTGDATLSITKTESKSAPFEAFLALGRGSLKSVASGLEPLAAIESAFAQLALRAKARAALVGETAPGELGDMSQPDTAQA